jgi:hypothetical protein
MKLLNLINEEEENSSVKRAKNVYRLLKRGTFDVKDKENRNLYHYKYTLPDNFVAELGHIGAFEYTPIQSGKPTIVIPRGDEYAFLIEPLDEPSKEYLHSIHYQHVGYIINEILSHNLKKLRVQFHPQSLIILKTIINGEVVFIRDIINMKTKKVFERLKEGYIEIPNERGNGFHYKLPNQVVISTTTVSVVGYVNYHLDNENSYSTYDYIKDLIVKEFKKEGVSLYISSH